MSKEVSLKDRIEKLYESGYINEFNYLESQLQEARYLVTILHKQTEEKGKEIDRLNNIISEVNRVLESILFELDQTGEAEQVIEKIEYCVKQLKEKE